MLCCRPSLVDSQKKIVKIAKFQSGEMAQHVFFLLFSCLVWGSLSPTPLSMPGFILVLIELILWTVDYGSHKDSQGKLSGGAKVGGGNFNRSSYIFGSVSPVYWGAVMTYLFLVDVMIYTYNLHGMPPLVWDDGTLVPIGFSICTVAGLQKNLLQHHLHYFCVLLANACAGMFFKNSWHRSQSLAAANNELSQSSPSTSESESRKGLHSANSVESLALRRLSVVSDSRQYTQSLFIQSMHLAHTWICWFLLLYLTLWHQTVLSFCFLRVPVLCAHKT